MSSIGKTSVMRREIEALQSDLRYNKEYKYLYTDSSDQDEGKVSAMRDPNLRALRNTSFRRSGKEETSCWKSCRKSLCCQILTSKKLWTVILISALIVAVKMLIDYEIPYCNAAQKSGCSYNSVWLWDCRPCPQNAICDGGKMTCNAGFTKKTEELCLREKENPYVEKLIDKMLEIDSGISILSRTFRDYGAADQYAINGEELTKILEPTDNDDLRYAAQQAIFRVFDVEEDSADQFCLNQRFVRVDGERFV